eukprot:1182899-Amphidinium_carterae.1
MRPSYTAKVCILDAHSHHAQLCCKFLHTRRRNAVRDLLQRYAMAGGGPHCTSRAVCALSNIYPPAGLRHPARRPTAH